MLSTRFNIVSWIISLVALFLFTYAALGQELPKLQSHVNDFAHVLSDSDRNALNQRLSNFERTTKGNPQVVVLITPSLGDESIEEYSNKVFHDWKLGHKDNNNGVLTVLSVKEHAMRIEVGYDLEPTLTDSVSKDVLGVMKPGLRAGNWNKALNDEMDKLLPIVTAAVSDNDIVTKNDTSNVSNSQSSSSSSSSSSSKGFLLMSLIIIIAIIGAVIYFVRRSFTNTTRPKSRDWSPPYVDNTYNSTYSPPRPYTPSYRPPTPSYTPSEPESKPHKSSTVESAVVGGLAGAAASEIFSSKRRKDDDSNSSSWSSPSYDSGSSWGSSSSSDSSSSSSSDSGYSGSGGDSGGGGSSDNW